MSNNVGASIKAMRTKKGLSQWSLANALGRSQAYISYLECGYVEPSEELLEQILATISILPNRNKQEGKKVSK